MNRNFIIILAGQIISLLGNNLLSFALPFFLLKVTGSGTVFGVVMALSAIPLVLGSPVGGVLADRVNKRNIMVCLDFVTFGIVTALALVLNESNAAPAITLVMLLLGLIRALYQPAVNASVPLVVPEDRLLSANSSVNMVTSVSSLLGPILGGLLVSFLSIRIILAVCASCFFFFAVMELFIRMPFTKKEGSEPVWTVIKGDLSAGLSYIVKEKPVIFKTILFAVFINLFLTCFLLVGVPLLVNVTYSFGSRLYGYSQSALGLGSLAGGILAGVFSQKIKMEHIYLFLVMAALSITPIGVSLMLDLPPMVVYAAILAGATGVMLFGSMFSIVALTRIQQQTPVEMLGKVMSLAITVSLCAQPLGQTVYGVLFDAVGRGIRWVVFGAATLTVVTAVNARKVYGINKRKNFHTYIDKGS